MDLRKFFGNWSKGELILITQIDRYSSQKPLEYIAKVMTFEENKVVLSSGTDEVQNPFKLTLELEEVIPDGPFYRLSLEPGLGIGPSYYNGQGLHATELIGPPLQPLLSVGNKFKYTSNTLRTTVWGRMSFMRNFYNSQGSSLEVNITKPDMGVKCFRFNALFIEE